MTESPCPPIRVTSPIHERDGVRGICQPPCILRHAGALAVSCGELMEVRRFARTYVGGARTYVRGYGFWFSAAIKGADVSRRTLDGVIHWFPAEP